MTSYGSLGPDNCDVSLTQSSLAAHLQTQMSAPFTIFASRCSDVVEAQFGIGLGAGYRNYFVLSPLVELRKRERGKKQQFFFNRLHCHGVLRQHVLRATVNLLMKVTKGKVGQGT